MKKIFALVLAVGSIFALAGCNKGEPGASSFTDLKKNQTLYIGKDGVYQNYVEEETSTEYLTCEVKVTYTLERSSYEFSSVPCVEYDSYYYYWETTKIEDEVELGEKKTKRTYTYSYLPFGSDNENIALKTSSKVQVSYDYKGGFVTKDREVKYELNGYFADWDELCDESSELADLIDISESKKYYVDTTTPVQVSSSVKTYTGTYYYFG